MNQDFEYKEYPTAKEYPTTINLDWFKEQNKPKNLINKKTTNIVSMGSCFANEVAGYFIQNGYNYPIYEKSEANFNADWNLVFTPFHMHTISKYTFLPGTFWINMEKNRWWPSNDPNKVRDPIRRNVYYNNNTCNEDFKTHQRNSGLALCNCDVLILGLGLTEIWRTKNSLVPFYRVPPKEIFDGNPKNYEFFVGNYDDCFNALDGFITLVRKNNINKSSLKTILSVSPIPLYATFRNDVDIITANQYSKSTLRSVCNDLVDNDEIFYFPSYEFVLSHSNPFIEDGRHIKSEIKQEVFNLFEHMFCKGE